LNILGDERLPKPEDKGISKTMGKSTEHTSVYKSESNSLLPQYCISCASTGDISSQPVFLKSNQPSADLEYL
jgi:hypothetical protein